VDILLLPYESSRSAPTRVLDEVDNRREDRLVRRRAFVIRPVHEHRSSDDEIARNETPVAAVFAIISIVAHYEVAVLRHSYFLAVALVSENVVVKFIVRRIRLVVDVILLLGLWFGRIDDL
jgi:hypothetical protein